MSKIYELFLTVKEADEADFGQMVVRVHNDSRPGNVQWGDYVDISLDKKHWVTCKLQPSGDIGKSKIYLSIHLRGLINKDSSGVHLARLEVPCPFYLRKASFWKAMFR